jgi:hypothetical protein
VTPSHTAADQGNEPEQKCVDASTDRARRMQGSHKEKPTEYHDGHPLQDAQWARFKPEPVLSIEGIGHQSCTGQKSEAIGDAGVRHWSLSISAVYGAEVTLLRK